MSTKKGDMQCNHLLNKETVEYTLSNNIKNYLTKVKSLFTTIKYSDYCLSITSESYMFYGN